MFWLLIGAALLTVILLALKAFERASVATIRVFLLWLVAFGGLGLTALLFLSGRGPQALGGLVMAGPLLWRGWRSWRQGGGLFGGTTTGTIPPHEPPRRQGGAMTRREAFEILGLPESASEADIKAAHHRLMRMAHPDTGGSDWLASRINQARDVLLG